VYSVCIDDVAMHVNSRVDEQMTDSEHIIVTIVHRKGRRKGQHT
jgi:hypothetical protein